MAQLTHVIFISRDIPIENSGGSSTYRLSLLEYFASRGILVTYVCLPYKQNDNSVSNEAEASIPIPSIEIVRRPTTPFEEIPVWNGPPTTREIEFVSELVSTKHHALVIADRAWLGGLFEGNFENSSCISAILTHDVNYTKINDYKVLGVYPYKRNKRKEQPEWSREIERNYLSKADMILAIQKDDFAEFIKLVPGSNVIHLPLAQTPIKLNPNKQVFGRLLFVGGGTQHNITGLTWFLKRVWPDLFHKLPGVSLTVCGDVCTSIESLKLDLMRVTLAGRVRDLHTEYEQAQVCIVPLLIGGGLKIKLVEALSYGKACVSTSVGVQGIHEVRGICVGVTDDPILFSTTIQHLILNGKLRKKFEQQGAKYIESELNADKIYGDFLHRVEEILENKLQKRLRRPSKQRSPSI